MSGGEKSAAIHMPLFAAANAMYSSAKPTCPRLVALDEAFAGIDATAGFAGNDDLAAELLGFRPARYVPADAPGPVCPRGRERDAGHGGSGGSG
jgi:hypothetical protein